MNDIEKRIIDTLKQYPYGLTISDLSKITKINRISLSKHLEILRERGYVGYRVIGKAKLWYLSEDFTILDAIYGNIHFLKILRQDIKSFYYVGDSKFVILPSEILQALYIELGATKNFSIIRNIGKKIGTSIATTFKMASGIERVVRENLLQNIVSVYEKFGLGKLQELIVDTKTLDTSVTFSYLLESEIIKDLTEDVLKDSKDNLKDYFTEGFLEGLFSTLYSIPVHAHETSSIISGNPTSDFIIKRK